MIPFKDDIIRQWPVILRGFLWVVIAVLTDLHAAMHDLTPAKLAEMTFVSWTEIVLGAILAGAIALRLYLDGSVARHQQNLQAEDEGIPYPTMKQSV